MVDCHQYDMNPPEVVANHVRMLYKNGIKYIMFVDNMINHSKKYILDLYDEFVRKDIINNVSIKKACIRTDIFDLDMALAFKEMDIKVYPGFESFSNRVLKLMDKGTTLEDNLRCLNLLQENDIDYYPFNIVGFPGENNEEFVNSLHYIESIKLSHGNNFCFFKLEGGTPIYKNPDRFNIKLITFPDLLIEKFPEYEEDIKSIPIRYIDLNDPDDKLFHHKRRINRLMQRNGALWNVFSRTKANPQM
jgi:radical SAM superfamily enzyme YgiQ (UPF0313 family)